MKKLILPLFALIVMSASLIVNDPSDKALSEGELKTISELKQNIEVAGELPEVKPILNRFKEMVLDDAFTDNDIGEFVAHSMVTGTRERALGVLTNAYLYLESEWPERAKSIQLEINKALATKSKASLERLKGG